MIIQLNCDPQNFESEILPTVEPLHTDNSLIRTIPNVPTNFSYISSKKPSVIRTFSKTDNEH